MPHRLIDFAQEIQHIDISAREEFEQSKVRSVINRAYYAAFLAARDFCQAQGLQGSGASHERVINALREDKKWQKQGNQLQQIKQLRHKADYDWQRDMTHHDVRQCMKKSRDIITSLT